MAPASRFETGSGGDAAALSPEFAISVTTRDDGADSAREGALFIDVNARPRRIAVISVHTSPLDQPGTGDAGGMNVYVLETAKRLARRGVEVDIFTRATRSDLPSSVLVAPGVTVWNIEAGPFGDLRKEDLPSQLCAMTSGLLHAATTDGHRYDLVHSHYWLSGHVGWLASERWGIPLVHTMHTLAKVKNEALAEGDVPEPRVRIIGEEQVVAAASALVANTVQEAVDLESYYDAPGERVLVAHPGVDLDTFNPADGRRAARRRLGIREDAKMLLFVGRIQPLKAPDVLINAAAELLALDPSLKDQLHVVICGGPSGNGLDHPESMELLAAARGVDIEFVPPQPRESLADYYRAADLVVVPSYSESFGLVAIEAQACGTPVIAAAVGGLRTAVAHDVSGILVEGHDPKVWAARIHEFLRCPICPRRLSAGAVRHAAQFTWDHTVDSLLEAYRIARGYALAEQRKRAGHV